MNFLVLVVVIDSIVVMSTGYALNRTAKREAKQASESFKTALSEVGPEVMAEAIKLAFKKDGE